ncbi:MAG: hypothetical protein ACRDF4_03155, partial [Rhabdochlamydiaceae bacterium]
MTCIVGIVENNVVYIGGDSASVNTNFQSETRADAKVFQVGEFLFGICGSWRMGQVLRFKVKTPERKENQNDYEYLVADWVDATREAMKESGCLVGEDEQEFLPGTFLMGYRGNLYTVDSDFGIGQSLDGMAACGCAG